MHDVFISYKSEEYEEARWIRDALEEQGIPCWMAPASIPGGSDYATEIPVAIKSCKIFVLVLSSRSQASRWVKRELDTALSAGKTVLPFVLEHFELSDDFGFYLGVVQRYDAADKRSETLERMLREIKVILGIKALYADPEQTAAVRTEAAARHSTMETDPEAVAKAEYHKAMSISVLLTREEQCEHQYQLGLCYEKGEGVPRSLADAMQWYEKAADYGYMEAQYRLAMCYLAGERKSKAIPWLEKAAHLGHAEAHYQLGMCYLDGTGVNEDEEKGMYWLREAGLLGHLRACFRLARIYESRLMGLYAHDPHRKECFTEATEWFQRAAAEEDPEAFFRLGRLYDRQDPDTAMNHYRQAAEQGHIMAQHAMGKLYFAKGKPQKAVGWLEKAARQGSPDAQYDLARYYREEGGVSADASRYWMEQAAEGGHGQAQFETACHYLQQPEGMERAIQMLRFAANKGLPDAVYALALCCLSGNGVEENREEALRLLEGNRDHGPSLVELAHDGSITESHREVMLHQAARMHYVPAMVELAKLLERENRTVEAIFWYSVVAKCNANGYGDYGWVDSYLKKLKRRHWLRWLLAGNARTDVKYFDYWRHDWENPVLEQWRKRPR